MMLTRIFPNLLRLLPLQLAAVAVFSVFPAVAADAAPTAGAGKTMTLNPATPQPDRFAVRDGALIDLSKPKTPVFFRGMGYSPFLPGETPMQGAQPGNDNRYDGHLALIKGMNANYIQVFPRLMPPNFFSALDKTDQIGRAHV